MLVGGPSFDIAAPAAANAAANGASADDKPIRRAAYMVRGYSTSRDAVPAFLQAFDVDDGRAPCPLRTQTVTAPQSLFMMNSDVDRQGVREVRGSAREGIQRRSARRRRSRLSHALSRACRRRPKKNARWPISDNDPARLKGLAWLLFNLDEFIYVRESC